jgi:acetyl esterase/lipase
MPYRKILLLVLISVGLQAQESASWTWNAVNDYRIVPNIVYSVANNYECKLDVYTHRTFTTPIPTVFYIHGGGWVAGTKEASLTGLLPYLEMGFNVINVEYRLARVSPAPAAVEDCRQALRWVFKNAKEYGIDTTKIIVTGGSAGGHLALMTGMLTPADGFDDSKEWDYTYTTCKVAAIINWFGITDVADLLSGSNRQQYAVSWFGTMENKEAMAKRVSPLTYVRKTLPPILTIHGNEDQLVPYEQAKRLHQALTNEGVQNQFITVPGGKHGNFTKEKMAELWGAIKKFLNDNSLIPN